jgi:general stress protein 26
MNDTETRESSDRLHALLSGIRVAMLTTEAPTGALQARPLTVQKIDNDAVWFLVDAQAEWTGDRLDTVNLSFVDGDTWVSVSGAATLIRDPNVLDELGDPVSDSWFDAGSRPAALRVEVDRADYWDGPGKLVQLLHLGKAAVTHERPDMGERGVIEP